MIKGLFYGVALGVTCITPVGATIVEFTDESVFVGSNTITQFEDFETISGGLGVRLDPLHVGSTTLISSDDSGLFQSGDFCCYPLAGNYIGAENFGGILLQFAAGITAVSFDLGEILETAAQMTISVTNGDGTTNFSVGVGDRTGFTFRGFTSDSDISSILLNITSGDGQFEALDNLRTGTAGDASPVPLPAAGWLMLAGLGALAAARRKRS
jgi:hypothetical protein